jgi:phosphate/sulfate permease
MATGASSAAVIRRRLVAGTAAWLAGCGYDTDLYGMYFPSWVVAPLLGGLCAALLLSVASRTRVGKYVVSTLIFCGLTVIFAVLIWAVFFTA